MRALFNVCSFARENARPNHRGASRFVNRFSDYTHFPPPRIFRYALYIPIADIAAIVRSVSYISGLLLLGVDMTLSAMSVCDVLPACISVS